MTYLHGISLFSDTRTRQFAFGRFDSMAAMTPPCSWISIRSFGPGANARGRSPNIFTHGLGIMLLS